MNETMQTLLTRRFVRAFKPDMLPRETIDAIIEAGIGDDDTAEVVDASNNSGSFHIYKSPYMTDLYC